MWKAMQWLQKNLIWSIPASMILGILIGSLTHPSFLRMTIIPLTFLMVYPMMVNLDIKRVFSPGDTKLQIVTQVMNFGIVPFLGFGMGSLFLPINRS